MNLSLPTLSVLKAFLMKCPESKRSSLLSFFSEEVQEQLHSLKEPSATSYWSLSLEKIHWSWFVPTIKSYSPVEQILFVNALTAQTRTRMCEELSLPDNPSSSLLATSFLRQTLLTHVIGHKTELTPPSYLPFSELNFLLNLEKKQLIELIDSLSLYDLGASLRQIVDPKILKTIYRFFSEEQVQKIKESLLEKYYLPKIDWDKWDLSEKHFWMLLHKRGLALFGIALAHQHPDLIWYICHMLDIGRGSSLFKLCAQEPIEELSQQLIEQILKWEHTRS